MIGMILTGHGEFAIGLGHSLQMIAGKQIYFHIIPFKENYSLAELENDLFQSMEILSKEVKGVIVFTDILGGTPFKTAIKVAKSFHNIRVVCGTNLPMLLETSMNRKFEESVEELVEQSVLSGRETIMSDSIITSSQTQPYSEDGI